MDANNFEDLQHLQKMGLGEGVEVYIEELPVCYAKAEQRVSRIWKTVKPKFIVHLGIATGLTAITLEQSGKNHGYKDRDVCGSCPVGNVCVAGGPDRLDSIIDMKSLTRRLKAMGLDVIYSRDAGRYLCDFVYYCSLHSGNGRAVFIHLPTKGKIASLERLVPLLQVVVMMILSQLEASSHPDQDQLQLELFNAMSV
ncbi:hypothetical protein GJAV_G00227960 [Gymnothorax javanicus]|nr:hypothetical protein GJAV_G00227960 [Gymnothorax javanicus]